MVDPFKEFEVESAESSDPFAEFATGAAEPHGSDSVPSSQSGPAGQLSEEELQQVARKHGVAANDLAAYAEFKGLSVPERMPRPAMQAAGLIEEGVLAGLGSKTYRALQSKEMEAALDDITELAQERKTGTRLLGEFATGVAATAATALIPGAGEAMAARTAAQAPKAATLARSLLTGAGYGAAAGIGSSKSGEEVSEAAKGAALGAAFGGALHGAGKLIPAIFAKSKSPQVAKETTDAVAAEIDRLSSAQLAENKPAIDSLLERAAKAVQSKADTFEYSPEEAGLLRELADATLPATSKKRGGSAKLAVKQLIRAAIQGEEYVQRAAQMAMQNRAEQKLASQELLKADARTGKFMDRAKLWISSGEHAAAAVDARLPTRAESILYDGTRRYNQHTVQEAAWLKANEKTLDTIHKNIPEGQLKSLADALDGQKEALAVWSSRPEYQKLRGIFDETYQDVIATGARVAKREHYFPHTLGEDAFVIAQMQSRATELEQQLGLRLGAGPLDAGQFKTLLESKHGQEFVSALGAITGDNINSPSKLARRFKLVGNPKEFSDALETRAGSFYKREELIPEFVREKDPIRALLNYRLGTMRHLALRDTIQGLHGVANTAINAGDKNAAAWATNLAKDLSGTRRGTLNAWTRDQKVEWKVKMAQAAERAPEGSLRRDALTFMARIPEALPLVLNQVYPNYLGWSPKAAITNTFQPLLMSIPELGYGYGSRKYLGALSTIAKIKAAGAGGLRVNDPLTARMLGVAPGQEIQNMTKLGEILSIAGKQAEQYSGNALSHLTSEMEKYSLYRGARKGSEAYAKAAMAVFQAAENMNRMTGALMGAEVAKDLLSKGPALSRAMQFVGKMGKGYQREVLATLPRAQAGDANAQARLGELMRQYVVGRTILNYNRITMSEYGRFVGPLFSVFTKWPTVIAGDILNQLEQKGALRGGAEIGRKYMAPLAALWAVDRALEAGMSDEDKQRAQGLFGKSGLAGMAPVSTIAPILESGVPAPPGARVARDLVLGIGTADMYKIWRGFNEGVNGFAPGTGAVNFFSQTLPQLVEGTEKERGTFLGKAGKRMLDWDVDEEVRSVADQVRESLGLEPGGKQ